ncbi:MAG: hypothetical protein NT086_18525 [Proteobacteria bacterium]|nr:hypothetical protein [Pseudomonadota bacterium]
MSRSTATAIHEGWESGSASLLSTAGVLAADENRAVEPSACNQYPILST